MKRLSPVILWLAALSAQAAGLAPIKETELPLPFAAASPTVKNLVCAEVMAGMAKASIDLYAQTQMRGPFEASVQAGAAALSFAQATNNVTSEDEAAARQVAQAVALDYSPKNPVFKPFVFCQQRMQRWRAQQVITQADYAQAEQEMRNILAKQIPRRK